MIAEPWGRPSLNALFGTEFISLCVSHKPHTALEEWQVGSVQREQMGPGRRESGLAIGVEQGACAEPGAPTAYSSLGKVSGDRREGGLLRGGRKIGVQELCWFVLNCCRIPSVGEKPIMRPSEGWQYTMPSELCLLPQATKDRTADGQALTEARKQLKEETQLRLVRTGGLGAHPTGLQRVTAMLSPCSIQVWGEKCLT